MQPHELAIQGDSLREVPDDAAHLAEPQERHTLTNRQESAVNRRWRVPDARQLQRGDAQGRQELRLAPVLAVQGADQMANCRADFSPPGSER